MPDIEELHKVVRQWIRKAEDDFDAAGRLLKSGPGCPCDPVCFHAQQCVEKYLKSMLVLRAIPFPKTHNLTVLAALIPVSVRPNLSPEEERALTRYATVFRYPGDCDATVPAEARAAFRVARRVRNEARRALRRELPRADQQT
jgi:HEPN domain-containing protein